MPCGVAAGDVTGDRAIIWSRANRPGRMHVEYATTESFRGSRRRVGPVASEATDFTTRIDVTGLPPGQRIFYRVHYEDTGNRQATSEPVVGSFQTPTALNGTPRDVTVLFSADTCGQGFGINPDWGGYRLYETMRRHAPDLFVNSGDTIYADQPLQPEVVLEQPEAGPGVWKNVVTEAKSRVAETLADFRGCHAYNFMDDHLRRFNAEVPLLVQWDDHEVHDNWYPDQILGDARYRERRSSVLSQRARQAFLEYTPIRRSRDPERIYRNIRYGSLLEIFMLDERSYRGTNSANVQTTPSDGTAFMGPRQMAWLKQALKASRATWKVIASDMPLSHVVLHDLAEQPPRYEAVANGDDGAPKGRELEIAGLLQFMKQQRIRNTLWITADVHYCAAHYYDPANARLTQFDPFWEFVAGPLNAGTAPPPTTLDATFGPVARYRNGGRIFGRAPSEGLQFFGKLKVDARTRALTASLHDLANATLFSVDLAPEDV
jgi:alkaline phosphatase D